MILISNNNIITLIKIFLCGFTIKAIFNMIYFNYKQLIHNHIVVIVLDILATFIIGIFFIFINNYFNLGQLRLFLLLSYLLGLFLETLILHKLFAKFTKTIYNLSAKIVNKLKNKKIIQKLIK